MSEQALDPLFKQVAKSALVRVAGAGYKELGVFEMDNQFFLKNGAYFIAINRSGRTSNSKVTWLRFSDHTVPQFDSLGRSVADQPWVAPQAQNGADAVVTSIKKPARSRKRKTA